MRRDPDDNAGMVLLRLVRESFILPIRAWQMTLGRMLPPVCRFTPSCSHYMEEAIRKRGVLRGVTKGLWRILRCNPLGGSGYDPVDPQVHEWAHEGHEKADCFD